MQELVLSTTVLASFIGGVLALLAPCCASVMLPAYFASSFRQRSRLVVMTVVFAGGVGTVILPIALGASALSRLLNEQHAIVFSIGGALMVLVGLAMLGGWKFMLPMPSMRSRGGSGVGQVYGLGAFSGAASACCAPVLAGVAAVSGAAASFPAALAVGVAYVFGMVAPLTLIALLWDRRDWGNARLLASRSIGLRLGRRRRDVLLSTLLSAALMIFMGVLTIVLALAGQGMATDGWQIRVTAALGHAAARFQDAISFVPGWLSTALVLGALALVLVRAARSRSDSEPTPHPAGPDGADRAQERTETAPTETAPTRETMR